MTTESIDCAPCRLRPWREDDVPQLLALANDAQVSQGLRDRFPFPYTIEDARWHVAHAAALSEASMDRLYAIEFEGRAIGGFGLHLHDDVYRHSAELGYWLGRPYWGRGLMTRVVRAAADYALPRHGLYRLAAAVYSNNPASGRVLMKAGFEFEGVQRCAVVKRGELLDLHMYAKTRRSLEAAL